MSSLYWILALTLTLLHCFTASTKPTNDLSKIFYHEIEKSITQLKNERCKENDTTFYTPSGVGECTIKALNCSILELEKVRTECFYEDAENVQRVIDTRENLKEMLKIKNITLQPNPINCVCEQEQEKTYNEFLDNILKLLQILNSKD